MPEFEYETVTCLKLTLEVMAWSLEGFFPEAGGLCLPIRFLPPGNPAESG